MGLSFSSVLVKGSPDEKIIADAMRRAGYVPARKGDEGALPLDIYQRDGSKWFALGGRALDGGVDAAKLAKLLAKRMRAPALAVECVDSDFMLLNLVDPATGKASNAMVGQPYEGRRPKADPAVWQAVAERETDFAALFKEEQVFAEKALCPLGDALGFAPEDAYACEDFDDTARMRMYVRAREPMYLEGSPALALSHTSTPGCLYDNQLSRVVFHSTGGASRGIDFLIFGEFVERGDLTFDSVSLNYARMPRPYREILEGDALMPIEGRIELAAGVTGYLFSFPDAKIPRALNPNHEKARSRPTFDLPDEPYMFLSFKPHKTAALALEVFFAVYPTETGIPGSAKWRAWCFKARQSQGES